MEPNLVFELAPDAMIMFDDEGLILAANVASGELFGVPPAEMVGKNLSFFGPTGYDLRPGIRGLVRDGSNQGEFRMTRGSGEIFEAEYHSKANIEAGCHLTIIRDGSDRKRLETSLRSSEQLFARSLITAPAAIAVSSVEHETFILANERFLALSGYWRSEVIGRSVSDLGLWARPEERTRARKALQDSPRVVPFRASFRTKAGGVAEVLVSLSVSDIGGQQCEVLVALEAE
jgi:PAS domain S-box-containing protein